MWWVSSYCCWFTDWISDSLCLSVSSVSPCRCSPTETPALTRCQYWCSVEEPHNETELCEFIKSRTWASHGHRAQITDSVLFCGGTYWSKWTTNSPVLLRLRSSSLSPAAGRIQTLLETGFGLIFHCCVLRMMKRCSLMIVDYWFNDRDPLSEAWTEL